ncbi:hypothetical protein [Streptomyces atratus]|uniref:hypothetical protein n=1 Tax=Streptomyces atratus TaxID=1893 RepID=UPI001E326E83|nr:hypothetical protein [Streptomyces atratus]
MWMEWRRQLQDGAENRQKKSLPLYQKTRVFRIWEPDIIWGTIQTANYAETVFEEVSNFHETPVCDAGPHRVREGQQADRGGLQPADLVAAPGGVPAAVTERDVVVPADLRRGLPPARRRGRRQRQHRGPAGLPPLGRTGLKGAVHPAVGDLKPRDQLHVEAGRGGEHPAGHERRLQVAVGPLDQTLGLRVAGPAQDHLARQQASSPVSAASS